MTEPTPQTVARMAHEPRFSRFERGRAPVSGRPVYGWRIKCSCGWSHYTNDNKRRAELVHREHMRAAEHAERDRG